MKYDKNGLIPVVVQDHVTGEVLMVAWSDKEAVELMKKTGYTHFWSRSRRKIWKKGEESGHFQRIISMQTDCDDDTILVRVEQTGPACHTGEQSCFHNTVMGDPSTTTAILAEIKKVISERHSNPKPDSYTNKLLNDENKMCKKIVEEAGELVVAIKDNDEGEIVWELADLIYHTMVAIEKTGVPMEKVYKQLAERRK